MSMVHNESFLSGSDDIEKGKTVLYKKEAKRYGFSLFAVLLSCFLFIPHIAHAEVRTSDIVMGTTLEASGISPSSAPSIEAEHAIVMDDDGIVYFERDADTRVHIASITKTMTAVVALDNADLDTTITISSQAAAIGESSAKLQAGDTLTLKEALKALMWPSGNDAAQGIAESVGALILTQQGKDPSDSDKALEAFVQAMNDTSEKLGMTNSTWVNPHGLDDGKYAGDFGSTARDVALLAKYAMSKDAIRSITSTDGGSVSVERGGAHIALSLESTDQLLGSYEGVLGVKTGFTDAAGECFAGAVQKNGTTLYSVVLDSTSEKQRFVDTTTLWDWVFQHRISLPLAHAEQTATNKQGVEVPVVAHVALLAWTDKTVEATLEDPEAAVSVFDLAGNVSQSVTYHPPSGAVHAGDVVGSIDFYQNNEVIASENLVALQDVAEPDVITSLGIWWQRFLAGFEGKKLEASSVLDNELPLINDKMLQSS